MKTFSILIMLMLLAAPAIAQQCLHYIWVLDNHGHRVKICAKWQTVSPEAAQKAWEATQNATPWIYKPAGGDE